MSKLMGHIPGVPGLHPFSSWYAMTGSTAARTDVKARDPLKELVVYLNETNQPELAALAMLIGDFEKCKDAPWFSLTMWEYLQNGEKLW